MDPQTAIRICDQHYTSRLHMKILPKYRYNEVATHVCMCRGRYTIPPDVAVRLPRYLADELADNNKEYLCEVVTREFKFFIDLDLPFLPSDERRAVTDDVARCLVELGVVPPGARIIFASCHLDGKSGYHVHVPAFTTNKETAKWLLDAMRTQTSATWTASLDASPYGGSLRVLYCSKAAGGRHIGREYTLEAVYRCSYDSEDEVFNVEPDDEYLEVLRGNAELAIAMCLVRVDDGYRPPTPHPKRACKPRSPRMGGIPDITTLGWLLGLPYEGPNEQLLVGDTWKLYGDGVVLVQTTCRYCPAKQGEHRNRRVALLLAKDGVRMLCMDDVCSAGGKTVSYVRWEESIAEVHDWFKSLVE